MFQLRGTPVVVGAWPVTELLVQLRFSVSILVEPAHEKFGDAGAVLFGHHLMAIPGQPDIFESHESGLYPRLIQPLCYAMRVRPVIACLPGNFEDRDSLQVHELVRGLLLNPARDEVWAIRLSLANRLQFGGFLDRRIIVNREIGHAPQTSRTCRTPLCVLNGWGDRFGCQDALDELRPGICDDPAR